MDGGGIGAIVSGEQDDVGMCLLTVSCLFTKLACLAQLGYFAAR